MYLNLLISYIFIKTHYAVKKGQLTIPEKQIIREKPQTSFALRFLNGTPDSTKPYKGSMPEINLPVCTVSKPDSSNKENGHALQENIIMKTQDTGSSDIKDAPSNSLNGIEHNKEYCQGTDSLVRPGKETPLTNHTGQKIRINIPEKYKAVNRSIGTTSPKSSDQASRCGLLRYRKWWELTETEILVNGKLITGIPIFIEENTMRIINDDYSYFIPLEKVDYIRTKDGLRSSFDPPGNKAT